MTTPHHAVLVRYQSDGSLDTSFASTGKKSFGGRYFYTCYAFVIQSGGVLIADTSGDFSTARIELTTPPEIAIDDSDLAFTAGDPGTPAGGKLKYDKNRFKVKYVPPKDVAPSFTNTFTYTLSDRISTATSSATVTVSINP